MSTKKNLKYFLGNTIEEAKETHDSFVKIINSISREYSLRTGIDKKELFNESFMALRKAKINYDKSIGEFNTYAINSIKRHLNEFISNNSVLPIPRYIKRTIVLIRRLEGLSEAQNYEGNIEDFILKDYPNICYNDDSSLDEISTIIMYLKNIADRSNTSLEKLIKRTIHIPSLYHNEELFEEDKDPDLILTIKTILDLLNNEQLEVASRVMEGKSKKQIAKEVGKSDTWVNNKLKEIKEVAVKLLD